GRPPGAAGAVHGRHHPRQPHGAVRRPAGGRLRRRRGLVHGGTGGQLSRRGAASVIELADVFEAAGARGFLHARAIDGDAEVGVERIAATLASLGLKETSVGEDCAQLLAGLVRDLGLGPDADEASLSSLDPGTLGAARALNAPETNRTTPREMTALLSMIWRD